MSQNKEARFASGGTGKGATAESRQPGCAAQAHSTFAGGVSSVTPADQLTPELLRYDAMVNGQGPGRPSFLEHPLHADFVALYTDAKALLTAACEASLQVDGSVASAAYAIRMRLFVEIMASRCEKLARSLIQKAKKQ
jgi:hypothetical protein